MSEGKSLLGNLVESAMLQILNAIDCYGWAVPATILTLLFLAVLVFLCWQLGEFPLEADVFSVPRRILGWARERWQISPGVELTHADR